MTGPRGYRETGQEQKKTERQDKVKEFWAGQDRKGTSGQVLG